MTDLITKVYEAERTREHLEKIINRTEPICMRFMDNDHIRETNDESSKIDELHSVKHLVWLNTRFETEDQLNINGIPLKNQSQRHQKDQPLFNIRKPRESVSHVAYQKETCLETEVSGDVGCRYLDPQAVVLPWENELIVAECKMDDTSTLRRDESICKFRTYLNMPASGTKQEGRVKNNRMKNESLRFDPICPLATPKGKVPDKCEVCNARAYWVCKSCRVTFYCTLVCGELDSEHSQVCMLLRFIRSGRPKNYTRFERHRFEKHLWRAKEDLVDRLMWQGIKALATGKYQQANASLNQSLLYTKLLVGPLSVEMLRLCLLKSQCSLLANQLAAAESELRVAEEVMTHVPSLGEDHMNNSEVARVTAQLEMTKGVWKDALFWFSEALLQLTYMNAHDSIYSARIYFDMGVIFFRKGQHSVAESFLIHSLDNYVKWLIQIYTAQVINRDKKDGIFSSLISKTTESYILSEVNLPLNLESDCLNNLKKLHRVFRLNKDRNYAKVLMSFALLSFFKVFPKETIKFIDGAKDYLSKQSDPILHHTAIDAYKRTRKYIGIMEKSVTKTISKWKDTKGKKQAKLMKRKMKS